MMKGHWEKEKKNPIFPPPPKKKRNHPTLHGSERPRDPMNNHANLRFGGNALCDCRQGWPGCSQVRIFSTRRRSDVRPVLSPPARCVIVGCPHVRIETLASGARERSMAEGSILARRTDVPCLSNGSSRPDRERSGKGAFRCHPTRSWVRSHHNSLANRQGSDLSQGPRARWTDLRRVMTRQRSTKPLRTCPVKSTCIRLSGQRPRRFARIVPENQPR